MAHTEYLVTSQLMTGDIIDTGIGRVLLTGPRHSSEYPARYGNPAGTVYWFDGRILDYRPTAGSDHRWIGRMNAADGRPATQWTVQGNDLARWRRHIPVSLRKAYVTA